LRSLRVLGVLCGSEFGRKFQKGGRGKKNRLFRIIEKKRRAGHDLISPGRTGWELAPAFPLWGNRLLWLQRAQLPQPLWIRFQTNCQRMIVEERRGGGNGIPAKFEKVCLSTATISADSQSQNNGRESSTHPCHGVSEGTRGPTEGGLCTLQRSECFSW